jgi:hypothetical protein
MSFWVLKYIDFKFSFNVLSFGVDLKAPDSVVHPGLSHFYLFSSSLVQWSIVHWFNRSLVH